MKIQDSFYYQDFSYVVRAGAAIADWRGSVKKAIHPAGFAVFGEVSISNKVETKLTIPTGGVSTFTPQLASILEANAPDSLVISNTFIPLKEAIKDRSISFLF